ncbi:hypothetical protein Leryth_026648 [Lithospermum erythrorhizon]|nr:hypothetical protein Leryth_026648 [Lithospermum erythrorhizon]
MRLWFKKDIVEVLSDITVFSEVERICIQTDLIHDNDIIKANLGWEVTFRNMNKLSLLELSGDFFKGNYNVYDSQPFGKLNKLRGFVVWAGILQLQPRNIAYGIKLKETPNFSYANLEVLNLRLSKMLLSSLRLETT